MIRGQAAMEYMIIFGFSLIVLGLLWVYSSSNIDDTRWELQSAHAKASLNKISDTAELAYIQGPPAQFYIYSTFPENIRRVYVADNAITMELHWKDGILRNISIETIANIAGGLSPAPGTHKILVNSTIVNNVGIINISDA